MNTKTVCEKLSVTPKMLRVYEEHGLIKPKRLENNYRDYSVENLVQIEDHRYSEEARVFRK